MGVGLALLKREIALNFGAGSKAGLGLVFFLSLAILFPFGVGPDLKRLSLIGPAILWTGPLLSVLLGLDRMFEADKDDGTLDAYRVSDMPMELYISVKALAHWLCNTLPLIIAAPFFGFLLAMEPRAIIGCFLCLLAGSPALVCFGSFGAALTSHIARSGMLLMVITIPLLIPVLIFGVSASAAYAGLGPSFKAPFLLLCAFTLFSIILACTAGAMVLRAGTAR